MENIDLIELQKQLDGITPGEWIATSSHTSVFSHSIVAFPDGTLVARIERSEDREFIAAAPTTIRSLMAWLASVWDERNALFKQKRELEAKLDTIKQFCDEGNGDLEVEAYLRNIKHIIQTGEADPRF